MNDIVEQHTPNTFVTAINDCFDETLADITAIDSELDGERLCLAREAELACNPDNGAMVIELRYPNGNTAKLDLQDAMFTKDGPFHGVAPGTNTSAFGVINHGGGERFSVYLLT